MSDDDFFERLRAEARPLRYQADEVTLSRIRANIRARLERPSVAQLLAAWFRPVLAAVALVASIAVFTLQNADGAEEVTLDQETVEIVAAGDTYRVE